MSELLKLAKQIRHFAAEIEKEAIDPKKEEFRILDPKTEKNINKEMNEYRTFLRSYLTNEENKKAFIGKLQMLFDVKELSHLSNRNAILRKMQQIKPLEEVPKDLTKEVIIAKIYNVIRTFRTTSTGTIQKRAVLLLKEILNYGVVRGKQQFRRLLITPSLLYNTFKTSKEQEAKEEQETKQEQGVK